MKSKFLAGLIATLATLLFVVGAAVLMVTVFDMDASNRIMTSSLAFASIAIWMGIFNWLKPKDNKPDSNDDNNARVTEL